MEQADFTIADVNAWARTKPADEEYDFTEVSACAVAQFGQATGRDLDGLLSHQLEELCPALMHAAVGDDFAWTFGALVTRLEALCPEARATKSDWLAIDAYMADIEQVDA